jgi:hypothetical protein
MGRPVTALLPNKRGKNMTTQYAYALGYWQGRAEGHDTMPQGLDNDTARQAWRAGYDKGVADYCAALEGEA